MKKRFFANVIALIVSSILIILFYKYLLDFTFCDWIAWLFIFFNIVSFFKTANSLGRVRKLALSGVSLSAFGAYVSLFVWKITLSSTHFSGGSVLTGKFDHMLFYKGIAIYFLGFLISFISLFRSR